MKVQERKVYRCDHCSKYLLREHAMKNHEKFCKDNPVNRHKCFSFCKHLYKGEEEGITYFQCSKTQKYLYSFKAEKSEYFHELSDEAERMPLNCELYEEMYESLPSFI